MKSGFRVFLACLLALAIPVQAAAMARALAAAAGATPKAHVGVHDHGDVAHAHEHGSSQPADPCDESGDPDMKCCHAHVAWVHSAVPVTPPLPPALERATYDARWTSFIPEEPSPPPIASPRVA